MNSATSQILEFILQSYIIFMGCVELFLFIYLFFLHNVVMIFFLN